MRQVELYTTDENNCFKKEQLVFESCEIDEVFRINVYPKIKKQRIIGFGGAFTESTAYTLLQLSEEKRNKILDLYFTPQGNAYQLCRTHIQSCDFSLQNYAYVEDPLDKQLHSFSISRDQMYIIPIIKMAQQRNKEISFLASPWSPPAFMKTNGTMNFGGQLLAEYMQMWADIFVGYICAYEKEGIKITRITVQNEPEAKQTWDSCTFTATEEGRFVIDYLAPALKRNGLEQVKILIWDHNKEAMVDRVTETLSIKGASNVISGIAFHWYTGDHFEAISITKDLFPDKEFIFTEGCVEYTKFDKGNELVHAEMYAHDILGNLNSGMNGYIDWNMVLNSEGGPNHVENYCNAPIMCDLEKDEIHINKSYYYIGHFSKFILPGARRIATTKYTDKIEVTAFENTDGSRAMVVLNRTNEDIKVHIKEDNELCNTSIKARSINTFIWE